LLDPAKICALLSGASILFSFLGLRAYFSLFFIHLLAGVGVIVLSYPPAKALTVILLYLLLQFLFVLLLFLLERRGLIPPSQYSLILFAFALYLHFLTKFSDLPWLTRWAEGLSFLLMFLGLVRKLEKSYLKMKESSNKQM
jgi:hypothetical protein